MKKGLKLAACLLISMGVMIGSGQAFDRIVFFESFTSTT